MSSKKFLKIVFSIIVIVWMSLTVVFVSIDPYNIFSNKEKVYFLATVNTSILLKKLELDKYSIVFGTSRSHQLAYDNSGVKILNFSGSLYGNSLNILEFLNQLNKKQISNIVNIYYLVDDHILNGYDKNDLYSKYKTIDYSRNLNLMKIEFLLDFNFNKLVILADTIKYDIFKNSGYYINDLGSMIRDNKYETTDVPKEFKAMWTKQYYTQNGVEALIKINKFCEENNITIKYFTSTHTIQYAKLFDTKIMQEVWTQLFDGGIKEFYALWYIDNISNYIKDSKYIAFKDVAHLNEYYNHKIFIENVVRGNTRYLIKNKLDLLNYIKNNQNYFK